MAERRRGGSEEGSEEGEGGGGTIRQLDSGLLHVDIVKNTFIPVVTVSEKETPRSRCGRTWRARCERCDMKGVDCLIS